MIMMCKRTNYKANIKIKRNQNGDEQNVWQKDHVTYGEKVCFTYYKKASAHLQKPYH